MAALVVAGQREGDNKVNWTRSAVALEGSVIVTVTHKACCSLFLTRLGLIQLALLSAGLAVYSVWPPQKEHGYSHFMFLMLLLEFSFN